MQASQSPAAFVAPFANAAGAGFIRTIPAASQIGITDGAASLHDGYPPKCFSPVAAGGVPPFGQDTNGILYQTTAGVQWQQVGGQPIYNSTFSTAIGGYPNGAILQSADGTGFWRSTADNNTSNPDTGGANWLPMFFSTSTAIALTNANVTLSAAQYSKPIIVLTGTLTAPVALTFPALVQQWTVLNFTAGSFPVTALTSGGVAVTLSQGGKTELRGNGANVVVDALQVGAPVSPGHAVNLAQFISGFNGNGAYYVFPGGMQLSRFSLQANGNSSAIWTFPLAFASPPQLFATVVTPPSATPSAIWFSSFSNTSATVFNANSASINIDVLAVL
ncbi:hypothetical protein FVF58_09630 [Paraburkholderia panacisoli]|uniref:Uncharacterized protein n=1 Tax=Paraburkholderia panacisoli TaxID=2603818 RepID=A0A5B0HD10_9BURK|nr:hypothetical protein [Paraburkholderia panacisoli]KAA1013041.1 hypothetical protein FVF58_09630 [Paraburkholderia panacisoli]